MFKTIKNLGISLIKKASNDKKMYNLRYPLALTVSINLSKKMSDGQIKRNKNHPEHLKEIREILEKNRRMHIKQSKYSKFTRFIWKEKRREAERLGLVKMPQDVPNWNKKRLEGLKNYSREHSIRTICGYCGKPITVIKSRLNDKVIKDGKFYCSYKCSNKATYQNKVGRMNSIEAREKRRVALMGRKFSQETIEKMKKPKSEEHKKSLSKSKLEYYERIGKERTEKNCDNCGKAIVIQPAKKKFRTHFCNSICMYAYRRKKI